MKLKFGIWLDGFESITADVEINGLTSGPLGLINLMEARLGLKGKLPTQATRILHFRQLLLELSGTGKRFYLQSLEKDSLAVAETLLGWRDSLIMAGWDGGAATTDSKRLQDLAALEALVESRGAYGIPDRLKAILNQLANRSSGIESLTVLDAKEHMPTLWQRLCDKLGAVYQPIDSGLQAALARGDTDLQMIQASLTEPSAAVPKQLKLKGDGSLLCLTAHSEVTLGHAVAQLLGESRKKKNAILLAGDNAAILDHALGALDEPTLGLRPRSLARPIPQMLLLALQLRWRPLDPRVLLEFLTHPVCPVSEKLRHRLADAVAASPGVGGPKWDEAVTAIREKVDQEPDTKVRHEALQQIEYDLANWLLCDRFDPKEGAPGTVLSECCSAIARWAGGRGSVTTIAEWESEQFFTLAALASELAGLIRPIPILPRVGLEGLIRQVVSSGWAGAARSAELHHVHRVSSVGALTEPADTIIWWDFSEPAKTAGEPWSNVELKQLAGRGAQFPSFKTLAKQASVLWLRPLLLARKKLILVLPRQRGGESVARHPLHSRLVASLEGKSASLPTLDLDCELVFGPASKEFHLASLPHRPLPRLQRWWKVASPKHFAPRERESYTSLEKFIYSPYAWMLRYKAKLQAGSLASKRLQTDSRQKGTLLHRLLDLLLLAPATEIDWRNAPQPALDQWLEKKWPTLLAQEGTNLLLPGKIADAAALLAAGKMALWELLRQLRSAEVTVANSNVPLAAVTFQGAKIAGFVDLLVKNNSGKSAVIDLKFGGRETRELELRQNRQLQLAVYGYLLNQQSGGWPATAFYILTRRSLIAQNQDYFPEAKTILPDSSPGGLQLCWSDFEKVWNWRRQQFDAGWIEVTVAGTEAGDRAPDAPDGIPPLAHWQATEDHAKYNDFNALTGWSSDA
jgi:RecB family exonuclease